MYKKSMMALLTMFITNVSLANLPYSPIVFPRDEGTHYDYVPLISSNLNEWWSINGQVTTNDHKHLGYVLTINNPVTKKLGLIIKVPSAYLQITDLDNQQSYGVISKYLPTTTDFSNQTMKMNLNNEIVIGRMIDMNRHVEMFQVSATTEDKTKNLALEINLVLETNSSPLFPNISGLINMGNNSNAYYYSVPQLTTTGYIKINQQNYDISNSNAGTSWMEHQWGDYDAKQTGWENFAIRLNNGMIANIFLNKDLSTQSIRSGYATITLPSGETRYITYPDFGVTRSDDWKNPKTAISYPQTFSFEFPSVNLQITNTASFNDQAVNGSWNGYCNVNATYQGQNTTGFSYTELKYKQ